MQKLHTPTSNEIRFLDAYRDPICVSLYLPTKPGPDHAASGRALFHELYGDALRQIREADYTDAMVDLIHSTFEDCYRDADFWGDVGEGLAVFVTPDSASSYRLPYAPAATVQVADRFHIKPLVLGAAEPGTCYVLSLQPGAIRLLEVAGGHYRPISLAGLPAETGGSDAGGGSSLASHACRRIDKALRAMLDGRNVPLILAGSGALTSRYRAINSYAHLADTVIFHAEGRMTDREVCEEARAIAVRSTEAEISARLVTVEALESLNLSSRDLEKIAEAAAQGVIRTLLVDPARELPGRVAKQTGRLHHAARPNATTYDVYDELIGLTVRGGGDVLPLTPDCDTASGIAAIFHTSTYH